MRMYTYEVGKPYSPTRSKWPEQVDYNYRQGQHEMRMFLPSPTREEIEGIRKGRAEFAITVQEGVIFLLYQFGYNPASPRGKALPWSDSPFSWWLVPEGERHLPNPETTEAERVLMIVLLIDGDTGVLLVQRAVTLSPEVSADMNAAIREQAARPFLGRDQYDAALASVYRRFADTLALLKTAKSRCVGGEE